VNNLTSLQKPEETPLQAPGTLYVAYQQPQELEANSLQDFETNEVLNGQWVRDYFGNDYSIAVPILQLFIEEMLPEIDRLETILQKSGVHELRKKGHKINPSFKMVGQTSLAAALIDLENCCISFEDVDDLQFKIKKIQVQTEKIKPLIVKQYNTISKLA